MPTSGSMCRKGIGVSLEFTVVAGRGLMQGKR
jgi:hypothetical protein